MGRVLPDDRHGAIPRNQFPAEVPGFADVFTHLFAVMEDFALRLLDAVAAYLGHPATFFRDLVVGGNSVLRVIAHEAGLPTTSGGCFVSGGSAGNLSALAVARETAKTRGATGRLRVVVGSDAHSSIVNTLRLLEMDALVVDTPDHRLTAETVRDAVPEGASGIAAVVSTLEQAGYAGWYHLTWPSRSIDISRRIDRSNAPWQSGWASRRRCRC